jgi:hypothetical protein
MSEAGNAAPAAHLPDMEDDAFDRALIAAWFTLAGLSGRQLPSVVAAARDAALPLERARARFPARGAVLMRFGRIADAAALTGVTEDAPVRDALFDMIMRRIDVLQAHRAGVIALLRRLPGMPPVALFLGMASERSMRWLLDAAGVETAGVAGALRVHGLVGVWLWTVRAWQSDESLDLSPTMAALDRALGHAERAAGWLGGGATAGDALPSPEPPPPEPPPPEPPPSEPPAAQPPDALPPDPVPPDPLPSEPLSPEPLPPVTGQPMSPVEGQPGLEQGDD